MSHSKNQKLVDSRSYQFSETPFKNLMKHRIYRVLIICSNYDYYMLEEDGRIDEQMFSEYMNLNLRYPPVFLHANSSEMAFSLLDRHNIDLIITMLSIGSMDAFELSNKLKEKRPNTPIIILTPFSREVMAKLERSGSTAVDYVFSWLGDTDILLAIIKLIEDKMNVEHDVLEVGVQAILLVEDSIRFYSSYLASIYKIVLKQAQSFMTEGLNEYREMLQMRGRPKILLATTYDEAIALYSKYKNNLLGVITDIKYKRNGVEDPTAGLRLCEEIKREDESLPILLQSSAIEFEEAAKNLSAGFLYKQSKTLLFDLREYIIRNFSFSDFVFRMPDGTVLGEAEDLRSLQKKMMEIPEESLRYHFSRNDFSRWLNARALFPIAALIKGIKVHDFESINHGRNYIYNAIANYRSSIAHGVIAKFDPDTFDEYLVFSRMGDGSLGGKARGLAFTDSFLKRYRHKLAFDNVTIAIPRTVVICTDWFDKFMETNNLYSIALTDKLSNDQILEHFIAAQLDDELNFYLQIFLSVVKNPIAIRSSSLLEDSHYQPFAGIYSTYMIPRANDEDQMFKMLTDAIKSVYASVFYSASKAYMEATSNVIDEEKMAIILQELCGTKHEDVFYPTFSGVARSINFYPLELEKPLDGIVNIAFGLGKTIVEGGVTLRLSPRYPKKVLQLSTTDMALKTTQRFFYALDLNPDSFKPSVDDAVNFKKLRIDQAEKHGSLEHVASTYDFENNTILDGANHQGKKIITFANILNHNVFPLAAILHKLLVISRNEMNQHVEIEFAVNLQPKDNDPLIFNFLQIRPIVEYTDLQETTIETTKQEDTIILSNAALGNGVIKSICDIVYIKPEVFNAADSPRIANEVEHLNRKFIEQGKNYVLVGPGRWGSSDSWLGIPVKWSQISAARVIVESGLPHYRIDPSQGTHFFQNLTSFRVGYFTINPYANDGWYDVDYLNNLPAVFEDKYLRHISFEKPLTIKIDGKRNKGVIYKNF